MSKRNSQANKAAARERLRRSASAGQEGQGRAARSLVAGAVVAVLALAGGIGYAVVQANKPGDWEAAERRRWSPRPTPRAPTAPRSSSARPTPRRPSKVYEDPRCPICAQFEQAVGPPSRRTSTPASSRSSTSARRSSTTTRQRRGLQERAERTGRGAERQPRGVPGVQDGAVLDEVPPGRDDDKFSKDDYLIKVADTVPALKGNASSRRPSRTARTTRWAMEMSKTFDKSGVTGTPTLKMDGKKIDDRSQMTPEPFTAAVDKAIDGLTRSGSARDPHRRPHRTSTRGGRTPRVRLPVAVTGLYQRSYPSVMMPVRDQSSPRPPLAATPRRRTVVKAAAATAVLAGPLGRPRSPPAPPPRPRLPARRRLRRPAARRHPAVDPRDPDPRGDTRLRRSARPPR